MVGNAPRVRLETSEGQMTVELWHDVAPRHAQNFVGLVHSGFYDNLTFHRVIPGFIISCGCPVGDGTGNAGHTLAAEFNDRGHERGVLSMARTNDPDSASSQFFICLERENCRHLDGQYSAFGKVIEGLDVLDRIAATPLLYPELGKPLNAPRILHAQELWDDTTSQPGIDTTSQPGNETATQPTPTLAPEGAQAPARSEG